MKFRVVIVLILFVGIVLPGINYAQNKVVVIPLVSGDCNCDEIPTVTSADGKVWMDRNLGALRVAQSVDDYHAYGWLYQWGRLADGHEDRGSRTNSTLSEGIDPNVPGHDDFILSPDFPWDWRNPQNDGLWHPATDINNPCPTGFRVPTEAEWQTEIDSWSSITPEDAFASPLKLVSVGMRNHINGMNSNAGSEGHYWTSTVSGTQVRGLHIFLDDSSGMNNFGRANGFSVRCIRD